MYILGLNVYHGDSSACLYKDGKLICAFEEERFTRKKHWAGFPVLAIKECLKEAGISIKEVDYITASRNPRENFAKKMWHAVRHQVSFEGIKQRLNNSSKAGSLENEFAKHFDLPTAFFIKRIHNIEHHRSHLASAFFASPFQESAILSIDAFGDFCSTMLATGKDNQITVIDKVLFPHSIGIFYTAFTQYLGFVYYGDEYKVMGLAPYGEAKYVEKVKNVLRFLPNGLYTWNDEYFVQPTKAGFKYENNIPSVGNLYSAKFKELFGEPRTAKEELSQYHKDLAASVQRVTEELIF